MQSPSVFIYGLRDTRGRIRYVGQSVNLALTKTRHKCDRKKAHAKWSLKVLERSTRELANSRERFHFFKNRKRGGCDMNGPRFIPTNHRPPAWHLNKRLLKNAESPLLLMHPWKRPA